MLNIKRLRTDTILNNLIKDIKIDLLKHNELVGVTITNKYYVTQDTVTIIFSAVGQPILRLDYYSHLNFASCFKYLFLIVNDVAHLSVFESQLKKLLS